MCVVHVVCVYIVCVVYLCIVCRMFVYVVCMYLVCVYVVCLCVCGVFYVSNACGLYGVCMLGGYQSPCVSSAAYLGFVYNRGLR